MTLEEFISRLSDILETEQRFHWAIGELLSQQPNTTANTKAIASGIGRSAAWVSEHSRTFKAFPEACDRAADMSWQVHVLCARTSDPVVWLEYAIENQCSTRELKDKLAEEGEIKSRGERAPKMCPNCLDLLSAGENLRLLAEDCTDAAKEWDAVSGAQIDVGLGVASEGARA